MLEKKKTEINITPWQKVQTARHQQRPHTMDYILFLMKDFIELHGDRYFGDDVAMISGIAKFEDQTVTIIGQQKGKDITENLKRNFGMAHPEGYRKALRIMKLSEKFGFPIIIFIDTPAAYPGIGAEERGQAEAIARNLREMGNLRVPIIINVIGEGGSGGALGIGVGDKILMLENAIYSVIPPEGCAAILFRDSKRAEEAANTLCLTAQDLLKFEIIDEIVQEPHGGAHCNPEAAMNNLKPVIKKHLLKLLKIDSEKLVAMRYEKFKKMGRFIEIT